MNWFKYGCFGCLGVLALLLVAAGIVGGLAWQRSESIDVQEQVLTRSLESSGEGEESQGVSPEALAADMPGDPVSEGAENLPVPGRVVLDLSSADFGLEAAAPGEPLRVEASFDRNIYSLDESFEQGEDGGWEYTVRFSRSGQSGIITALSELISGSHPRVRIFLPPDHPMALEMDVNQGGLEAELGGLWLTSTDLEFGMGGINLRFGEPLKAPMERLTIHGRMGGANFTRLGNASPRILDFEYSMGGMNLDLSGQWREDAEISIETSMGGARVHLPDGVNFVGLPPEATAPPEGGPDAPTLTFNVSSSSGELEFD